MLLIPCGMATVHLLLLMTLRNRQHAQYECLIPCGMSTVHLLLLIMLKYHQHTQCDRRLCSKACDRRLCSKACIATSQQAQTHAGPQPANQLVTHITAHVTAVA